MLVLILGGPLPTSHLYGRVEMVQRDRETHSTGPRQKNAINKTKQSQNFLLSQLGKTELDFRPGSWKNTHFVPTNENEEVFVINTLLG